jgi:hypothetical protein
MLQIPFPTRIAPQLFTWEKSPLLVPVKVIDSIFKAALLVLVKVEMSGALAIPTVSSPKFRFAGASADPPPIFATKASLWPAFAVWNAATIGKSTAFVVPVT